LGSCGINETLLFYHNWGLFPLLGALCQQAQIIVAGSSAQKRLPVILQGRLSPPEEVWLGILPLAVQVQ